MIPLNETFVWWTGVVEDRKDPLFLGRCRVRIHGHHTKFIKPTAEGKGDNPSANYIPIEDLPWAVPVQPITSAAMTGIGHAPVGPVEGTWVFGFFLDGQDMQQPVMVGTMGGIELKNDGQRGTSSAPTGVVTDSSGLPTNPDQNNTVTPEPVDAPTPPKVAEQTGGVLGPLSQEELDNLYRQISIRESGGNYNAVNQLGYLGKYQFGAAALQDLGYTRTTKNNLLTDPNAWTGKGGVTSKEAFLASSEAQEAAMAALTKKNYNTLLKMGVLTPDSTKEEVGGYLAVAHLLGPGGARDLKNGKNGADANGTKGSSYYQTGSGAVGETQSPKTPGVDGGVGSPKPSLPNNKSPSDPASFNDSVGFRDPNKVYPKFDEYDKRPDTNYLAYNARIHKTHVKTKEDNQKKEVPIANEVDADWNQPLSPYNAQYPYNHVWESESGHVEEFDDTPQNERINRWHRKGTFEEIDRNGTKVSKIVGDGYFILDRDGYVVIGGKCNVTVEGSARIYVQNDADLQVDGDVHAVCYNNVVAEVSGKMDVSVRESFHLRAKSIHFETEANENGESFTLKNKSDGAVKIESIGTVHIHSELDAMIHSNLKTSVSAGGILALDGATTWFNSGMSVNPDLVDKSLPGEEDMFEPAERKNPEEPEFDKLDVPHRGDTASLFYDEPGYPPDEVAAYIQSQVDNGTYEPKTADPEVTPDTTPPPEPPPEYQVERCPDGFELADNYSPALQLSPSFTLGSLSSGAAATQYSVKEQRGKTKGQIACSLRTLALNALEPIKARFPNMMVTSGFRDAGGSSKVSQHEVGEAADLQFAGMPNSGYYDAAVWIRDNVPVFDQLILEYKSTGTKKPWIHVSVSQAGNRKQVLTMYDHKVVSNTLDPR